MSHESYLCFNGEKIINYGIKLPLNYMLLIGPKAFYLKESQIRTWCQFLDIYKIHIDYPRGPFFQL